MDKNIYLSLLLDYYGQLLTEKQREYADLYYNENLTLSEIAENDGISRQAVRDVLLRAESSLTDTEKRTGLFERHSRLLKQIDAAEKIVAQVSSLNGDKLQNPELLSLCAGLQSLLEEMKL